MPRRTLVIALAIATATAALSACSAGAASSAGPTVDASVPATLPPTTPAAATVTPGFAPAKTLAVSSTELQLSRGDSRPLPTTVWYPTTGGPYPLILFSHGLNSDPVTEYGALLSAWAKAGFVVAAPAYPHTAKGSADLQVLDILNQPADAGYVITQVLDRFPAKVDPKRVAAAGHSAGGITTLAMFSSNRDTRLVAGVVIAGKQVLTAAFTGPSAPMLFVHGRLDNTVAYADGHAAYDAVPWPKAFLTVTRGGHSATDGDFDLVAGTTTDFWRWSLYGDAAAKSRLPHDATKGGLATLAGDL